MAKLMKKNSKAMKKLVAAKKSAKKFAKKPAKKLAKKPAKKTAKKLAKKAAKKLAKKPVKKTAKKVAKKPVRSVKKVVAKRPVKKLVKKAIKRIPPRIVKRPSALATKERTQADSSSTQKSISFAMSIAKEMKRSAAIDDKKRLEGEIRLSRRPTTRLQGRSTEKFPAADLREFRRRLMDARNAALTGADRMRATGFNESEDHEADGGDGTNQTLRLQALGQVGQINRTIQQIDEALHRIDDGSYGVCTICGQLIRKPRLLNQPFVLTCMECQSEVEKRHG